MADYIDRQAAINETYPIYIDGESFDVVQVETLMGLPSAEITEEDVREWCNKRDLMIIDNALYVEMKNRWSTSKEVVRCRDCKHYDLAANGFNGMCNRQYATFYANDFCSYGERSSSWK